MKRSRRVALILVAMLSFSIAFSAFFVVKEANHDCCGDKCPICYQISMCESTLKTVAAVGAVGAAITTFALVLLINLFYDRDIDLKQSLFARRVKLSI